MYVCICRCVCIHMYVYSYVADLNFKAEEFAVNVNHKVCDLIMKCGHA